jgi:hypothetical protein
MAEEYAALEPRGRVTWLRSHGCEADGSPLREQHEQRSARADAPSAPTASFPSDALGFAFGSTPEAAEQACRAGGMSWSGDTESGLCTGPAADIGHAGTVLVMYCGEPQTVCSLTFSSSAVTDTEVSATFNDLSRALAARYGAPIEHLTGYEGCAAAGIQQGAWAGVRMGSCAAHVFWRTTGGSIALTVDGENGGLSLVLSYFTNASIAEAESRDDSRSL